MILRALAATALVSVSTCQRDETAAAYGAADVTWQLAELNGSPFNARATLKIAERGGVSGQGPCNAYSGASSVPYPWFKIDQLLSTKVACPDLDAEAAYFIALQSMTAIEVLGTVLILRNDAGDEMVFGASE